MELGPAEQEGRFHCRTIEHPLPRVNLHDVADLLHYLHPCSLVSHCGLWVFPTPMNVQDAAQNDEERLTSNHLISQPDACFAHVSAVAIALVPERRGAAQPYPRTADSAEPCQRISCPAQ